MAVSKEAQELAAHLKKDSKILMYCLSILKELEHTKKMLDDMAEEKQVLAEQVGSLESDLRLARGYYRKLQKEHKRLKQDLIEWTEQN